MKILITESIGQEGLEILQSFASLIYKPNLWKKEEELYALIADVDALIVRNQTRVTELLLTHGKKLKVIGRLGVGLDNIDLNGAKIRGISVVSARNANAISVAEYVMAAILGFSRRLNQADDSVKGGDWERGLFTGREVYGKTLGLIGLGEISSRVAKRAAAFGMNMIGYDPYIGIYDYVVSENGIKQVPLQELLFSSDFISIHIPLTEGTKGLLQEEHFKRMKRNAVLINTSRGGIIDEKGLVSALKKQEIAGVVLDVFEKEPLPQNHPLLYFNQAVLTPHIAGLTTESQDRTSKLIANEVIKILRDEPSIYLIK